MEIKLKSAWDKLSMLEKALLIKLSVDNGVSSLKLIRDTYNLYSSGGDLVHKKSGKEQNESQDLNSSWLPQFAYTPSATQSQILNVLGIEPMTAQELYTAQEVVKEIDNPGYTQMKQNAQKAHMLKALHIVEENPGLLNMAESGVIDYLPVLGDAKLAAEAAAAALQGDFTEAALLGMFTILPGATDKIASKALKNITKQDRDFIKAANLYFKKYGYEPLDLNLADLGRSIVNLAIKDRINHLNTVSRGVYTIKDSFLNSILNLSVDDIVQVSKNQGINFNDVKNAFELNKKLTNLGIPPTAENRLKYSLTHIPGHTGHGRAGLTNGELALYTSNSWGDINSVADRYSMPQWANPEIYEGAVGVLRRKFLLSPDNNRNKWFFEGDFPLLNRNNDVYPVLRYLKSHAEPNRKIEIDKDILNKVYEYVKDTQKLGRAKNKSIWNELNNTQSILKTRGFPYNIHIKNEFLLEAILDYLKNLDSPILNKKDISNIYNIIGKYKWVETPLFDKINTRQAIQLGYKKVYQDLKFVQSLLDLYFPNIWLLYVEFPIKTTESLKRAPKGVNRILHFIFTGIPGEEPVELLEYIPTNYNKNLSHGHNSNTTPGTRKTFSTGGPLYPFSFEKNPFLKTPIVRYDEGGEIVNINLPEVTVFPEESYITYTGNESKSFIPTKEEYNEFKANEIRRLALVNMNNRNIPNVPYINDDPTKPGNSCLYTFLDNYPVPLEKSNRVFWGLSPEESGFKRVDTPLPGDGIQVFSKPQPYRWGSYFWPAAHLEVRLKHGYRFPSHMTMFKDANTNGVLIRGSNGSTNPTDTFAIVEERKPISYIHPYNADIYRFVGTKELLKAWEKEYTNIYKHKNE